MSEDNTMSADEHRRQMRVQFDAVNTASQERRQTRRDIGDLAATEENKRWVKPEVSPGVAQAVPDDNNQVGENDSLGG